MSHLADPNNRFVRFQSVGFLFFQPEKTNDLIPCSFPDFEWREINSHLDSWHSPKSGVRTDTTNLKNCVQNDKISEKRPEMVNLVFVCEKFFWFEIRKNYVSINSWFKIFIKFRFSILTYFWRTYFAMSQFSVNESG